MATDLEAIQQAIDAGKGWVTALIRDAWLAYRELLDNEDEFEEGEREKAQQVLSALAEQAVRRWLMQHEWDTMDKNARDEWGYPASLFMFYNGEDVKYWTRGEGFHKSELLALISAYDAVEGGGS